MAQAEFDKRALQNAAVKRILVNEGHELPAAVWLAHGELTCCLDPIDGMSCHSFTTSSIS